MYHLHPVLQVFIMPLEHECLVLSKIIFVFIMLSDECQPDDTVLQVFYDLVFCFSIGKTFSFVVVIFIYLCSLQSSPLFLTLNVLFIA